MFDGSGDAFVGSSMFQSNLVITDVAIDQLKPVQTAGKLWEQIDMVRTCLWVDTCEAHNNIFQERSE